MSRAGRKLDIKSCQGIVKRTYSKVPRLGDGLEEYVSFNFEHLSTKRSAVTGSLNDAVEIIYSIYISSVQLSEHLRESPVQNRSDATAFPMPALGRGVYLECTMYCLASVDFDDGIMQVSGFLDRIEDPVSSDRKHSRRCCCFQTWTRYMSTNTGSILKSLESDVDVC